MKITIEPTHKDGWTANHPTVIIDQPSDALTLDEALELVAAALKAYGYAEEAVNEAIPPR